MVDSHAFRAGLGRFCSGVNVVTTVDAQGRDHGMTVSAFCSVSLEPPLVLVCIGHDASMYSTMEKATHFTVNILSEGQEAIARRFAETSSDRFSGIGFTRGQNGMTILDEVLGFIECEITERYEAGDHDILIGAVTVVESFEGKPLLYYRGGYAQLER